ncbi:hypothetical protein [Anaerolentibacter hominis]|uniref:hypothetical protein n=1 Tax=Anaerolentibacter hominis TaxID=3079009 RepID=UPI0031B82E8A
MILDDQGAVAGLVKNAELVDYDNASSGLTADTVQGAIDELKVKSHMHENVDVLSGITNTKINHWDTGYINSIELNNKVSELSAKVHTTDVELEEMKNDISGKSNRPEVISYTLTSSGWTGSAPPYIYQITGYDGKLLTAFIDSSAITTAQLDTIMSANIQGTAATNALYCWGDKPTIDLPIALEVQ